MLGTLTCYLRNIETIDEIKTKLEINTSDLIISTEVLEYNIELYTNSAMTQSCVFVYKNSLSNKHQYMCYDLDKKVRFQVSRLENDRYLIVFITTHPEALYFDFMSLKKEKLNRINNIGYYMTVVNEDKVISDKHYKLYDLNNTIIIFQ